MFSWGRVRESFLEQARPWPARRAGPASARCSAARILYNHIPEELRTAGGPKQLDGKAKR